MKISVTSGKWQVTRKKNLVTRHPSPITCRGFTMVEIAISLAIIGIALLGIIGVLPLGLHTQRDNREQTIINQDASVLLEAIHGGARGLDDLTNYVYAITNYSVYFANGGSAGVAVSPAPGWNGISLTNGANIIGLMSTPEFTDGIGNPTNNLFSGGYSNHVVAYIRSLSGTATEKPPQDNAIMTGDSFTYRLLCVNAPMATDTNALVNFGPGYLNQLSRNLHEIRLLFLWPQRPNGSVGNQRQTFRASVGGQISHIYTNNLDLYFYQPQSFTSTP